LVVLSAIVFERRGSASSSLFYAVSRPKGGGQTGECSVLLEDDDSILIRAPPR
jgi:hypothetical protein